MKSRQSGDAGLAHSATGMVALIKPFDIASHWEWMDRASILECPLDGPAALLQATALKGYRSGKFCSSLDDGPRGRTGNSIGQSGVNVELRRAFCHALKTNPDRYTSISSHGPR